MITDSHITHAFVVFMGFFAVMNPIANTPVFLSITADDTPAVRRIIALRALTITCGIIALFAVSGHFIFTLFGISLYAFRIAGGVLIALIGYRMLHGGTNSSVHHPDAHDIHKSAEAAGDVAITPLAIPILAGPGTITTALNFASGGIIALSVTLVMFFILCLITYVLFLFSERIMRFIGESGIKVITRLMGLLLTVVGVQMLIQGVYGAVNAFPTGG